ncbi:MAG: DNA ligase D [Bacteroidota bacterium]
MGLQLYNKKRNFKKTPEPSGKAGKSKSELSFVVQRHKASRLHYDFRLELDGVLKSWAVPKGPSLNPGDKRLAMMVEDHPFDYKDFAGIIPEGNYGAGIVEIWDKGYFSDLDNSEKTVAEKKLKAGLKAGNLKFRLYGKKLKGEFVLVKLKGNDDNAWLLIKHKDEYAVKESYSSEENTPKNSPINKWLAAKKSGKIPVKKTAKKKIQSTADDTSFPVKKGGSKYLPAATKKLNDYVKPMLAKETDKPFNDKNWVYEIKWDGYRAIADINGTEVSLYSRNGNTFNASYPIVVNALKQLNIHAILDGEIVVMEENGKANFQLLQHYGSDSNYSIQFCVFDVLSINGQNTCDLPLVDRKKLLKKLLSVEHDVIKYSEHIEEEGVAFFEAARKSDLEGIMAKQADSQYYPGARTSEWLKVKLHKTTEAIIAGFTEPTGSRKHFGALVLGIMDKGKLEYIGHTGSGFSTAGLTNMNKLMKPLIQKKSPFAEKVKTNMPVTWIKPVLVCEIKYTEWTKEGRLRHPIFLRLRSDKKADQVNLKALKPVKKPVKGAMSSRKADLLAPKPVKLVKTVAKKGSTAKKTAHAEKIPVKTAQNKNDKTITFGKIKVNVSNFDKVFWPEEGITKGDVINYYISISKYILPYLKDRPESLKRNPNGIKDFGFFHKDAGNQAPEWVKSKPIFSESTNKDVDYILCNNQPTLTYLNNLGCIEINPWHSTIQALDHPDYLIVDIDPSDENTFDQVIETANVVHDVFKQAGVESYCKTSGATGLHIYVPAQKKYTYDQLKDFSHLICILVQEQLPAFTTLERNLKKRGNKMIYLDHLQNRRGQTISSVYSLRPKEGATVSMPVKWKEVKPGLSPMDFTIYNSLKRIERNTELFSPVLGKGIDLEKCLKLLNKQGVLAEY